MLRALSLEQVLLVSFDEGDLAHLPTSKAYQK